jgi:biopolymer transport protein ExbD
MDARPPNSALGDACDGILDDWTSGGASLTSEINVTRLIDVLLVMLIIFMVIVPVMPRGLNSALPSASTPVEGAEHLVVVQVEHPD